MCFIFIKKSGFKFLYSTEGSREEANHIPEDECLESRMMYLDLLGYRIKKQEVIFWIFLTLFRPTDLTDLHRWGGCEVRSE